MQEVPYGLPDRNRTGSVYPGGTMIPPQWWKVFPSASRVLSWPPWGVLEDVKAEYTLSASTPRNHRAPWCR